MSFNWPKHYKTEEWIENEISEAVFNIVTEQYGIEDVTELSKDQLNEVMQWAENHLPAFSLLKVGFTNISESWEITHEL
jgi:hypothetical protein